ncbi:hypothetical protein T281_16315 [Rhodomicrobium udaipurense JA643]|uniref:Uncharacterized protein n=1 Tax=Rhodomicrobium udaipurense TaxID=1202716 RepID=A0A8I1KLB0_9HYPH|nr:hypothetical protein [Rhodomicrobium udaipurense]KAI93501.1 hypothetical protein T281_16315 [Rhodomicrobium udaipurense JA643]MBJ7545231.1 hypothetical protein [Rhodomicrobium udaipurense]
MRFISAVAIVISLAFVNSAKAEPEAPPPGSGVEFEFKMRCSKISRIMAGKNIEKKNAVRYEIWSTLQILDHVHGGRPIQQMLPDMTQKEFEGIVQEVLAECRADPEAAYDETFAYVIQLVQQRRGIIDRAVDGRWPFGRGVRPKDWQ